MLDTGIRCIHVGGPFLVILKQCFIHVIVHNGNQFRFPFACICLIIWQTQLHRLVLLCNSAYANRRPLQEALYNIARAYHHIGMITLAATYYEKVLAIHVNEYPIPEVPKEIHPGVAQNTGHCDLRREASYNLHLIYRNSGAFDLARRVLRDHCTV